MAPRAPCPNVYDVPDSPRCRSVGLLEQSGTSQAPTVTLEMISAAAEHGASTVPEYELVPIYILVPILVLIPGPTQD